MKLWKQFKSETTRLRSGFILLLLLLTLPSTVFAEGDSYTMSLRTSSETVAPGDTVQLAVQVHNDGWPQSGEAEVAAFQVKLEYDHSSLEYVSVEIPEGTMGDFSPESSLVLGYGKGHPFQEYFDCAVLTMKVAEGVSGEIPLSLTDPILARQDATELKVSPSGPLTLKVGNTASGNSSSAQTGNGSVAGTGGSGEAASAATGNTGTGSVSSASSGSRSDGTAGSGESASPSGTNAGSDAVSPDNGSGESAADGTDQGKGNTTDPALSSKDDGSDTVTTGETTESAEKASRPGLWLLWGVVPVAAVAVAGIWFWRKRRG